MKAVFSTLITLILGVAITGGVKAAELKDVTMVIFGPPSLGAFLPPIIQERELDRRHGLKINFVERPPTAYYAQFNSGEFKLGGSAALLSTANAKIRGVDVTYLFNLFDYFGAVVTTQDDIQNLSDLEGRTLAAATATTNYAMFRWLLNRKGIDAKKIGVVNTAPPGLIGYVMAGRADAVQLWEPAYSVLLANKPGIRTLELGFARAWKEFSGSSQVPYLGVAAHTSWVAKNGEVIERLERIYADAASWIRSSPDAAGAVIAARIRNADRSVITSLIRSNQRLGLNVQRASEIRGEIEAVFRAGVDSGYLERMPERSIVFTGQ